MKYSSFLAGAFIFLLSAVSAKENLQESEPDFRSKIDGQDFDEIVFVSRQMAKDGHWYANFGYYAEGTERVAYAKMGRLCKLNIKTGKLTILVDDPEGSVRDPQVHYDAKKILFSYRKGGTENFHLYEINIDGSNLKQITDGPYTDFEPTYLADGGIIFCSNRCNRWVNCWLTQVAVLYRCDADGTNIHQISANLEQENTPWPLHDGRILYQRWEYIDRSQVNYHHLWTMNPDGTGQMIYYGNFNPGTLMIDAKPIPGSDKVVAVFSPGHGRREHDGAITIVTPKAGPDEESSARRLNKDETFRDPFPLSAERFLVAQRTKLLIMDDQGKTRELYRLPEALAKERVECHEPRPIRPKLRERVISERVDLKESTGRLILSDVYNGRNMEGIERGNIKSLMLIESLPKPINYTGGMEPLSYGGTFTLERILGTVPVQVDGSAYIELPANRSFFFVALDAQGRSVKRMQSFVSVMPGETTSCVGCHEPRTRTPNNSGQATLLALKQPPTKALPIQDQPQVFDFPRDIQPILDRHCLKCHDTDKRKGGVLLTGDHGPMFSHSYFMLTARRQVSDGRNLAKSNYAPRKIGSMASPLMDKIEGKAKGPHKSLKLSPREIQTIRLWIDTGGAYPGTYAALGNGMIGGYTENKIDRSDTKWESMKVAQGVLKERCLSCHKGKLALPDSPSDNMKMPPWQIKYGDPKLRFSRHILYNLSQPERSLQLLAPLAKKAGGYGICQEKSKNKAAKQSPVFRNTQDPDYQKLLAAICDTKSQLDKIKRFDMPGFQPPKPYIREMKRFGVLPENHPDDAPIDVYETDRAYWRSLWWQPLSESNPKNALAPLENLANRMGHE